MKHKMVDLDVTGDCGVVRVTRHSLDRPARENTQLEAVGGEAFWRYEEPAPLGEKLLLLTVGGIAVIGKWASQRGDLYLAWSYLPKRNKEQEHRIFNLRRINPYVGI